MPSPGFSTTCIAGIVDEVHVVAGPAEHGVGPGLTVEEIVAGVACQRVGVAVAVSLQIRAARQGEVFDVLRQPVMRRRVHRVDAFIGALDDEVAGIVDDVGVVAEATNHHVGAGATVERIVAAETNEHVGGCTAGDDVGVVVADADESRARQGQVLDIGAERVVDRRLHRVGALADGFRHHVADIIDDIGVVARSTRQGVVAGPAVERIVAVTAEEGVVAAQAGQGVVAAVAGDDVGILVPGPGCVVVDRGRQVIDVEALVEPARAVVRRVPAGAEQHARRQVGAGGGVVVLLEMEVVVVLERRGGSDQRAVEIDADD